MITKRVDFLKMLKNNGWYYKRSGGNHDLYTDGINTEAIPRHKELNEGLVKSIIKKRGLK